MEIITTVVYDGHRHSLNAFVKKHIKIMIIPMMPAKVVHDAMNNRNMIDAISVILQYNWIPGRLKEGATTGQRTYLKLAGGLQAVVHLIINSAGDRLCMIDIIEPGAPRALIVAYVGNRAAFDTYMREMNITELELYSRLKHLEED